MGAGGKSEKNVRDVGWVNQVSDHLAGLDEIERAHAAGAAVKEKVVPRGLVVEAQEVVVLDEELCV